MTLAAAAPYSRRAAALIALASPLIVRHVPRRTPPATDAGIAPPPFSGQRRGTGRRTRNQLAHAVSRYRVAAGATVLPDGLRHKLETSALLVGPGAPIAAGDQEITQIRRAIRLERKLDISYRGSTGDDSTRTIWPFALGFFDRVRVVAAWCEMRVDFRHFRTDRITRLALSDERYPRSRQALLGEWRQIEGIPAG